MTSEEIEYQPEEPAKIPMEVNDWRLQEVYNMAPDAVMEELLGLDVEILDAKTEWEEVRVELRDAQERLKLMEAQVLQAAMDSGDATVTGKNAEERKRRAAIYLAGNLAVKQLRFEIKPLESAEVTTRLAMEALLDRQKNLSMWARMFEVRVELLSTVRAPEITARLAEKAPVLTEEDVAAIDELFLPEVEIPPSMGVSEEEAEDLKVAIGKYGEKVDSGSLGPTL